MPFDALLDRLQALADAAADSGDFAACDAALIDAIANAESSEQLWALLSLERIDDATFGEDELPPAVAHALIAKAKEWPAHEQALAIGVAVRPSALDPAPFLRRNRDDGIKPAYLAAIEQHADFFRAGLASSDAIVRSASAQALAHCRNVTAADVAALGRSIVGERDDDALAAMLLASGSAQRWIGTSDGAPFAGALKKRAPLVKACAAAAWASTGATLDAKQSAPLAKVVEQSRPLPAEWGWRLAGRVLASEAIALRVIDWAPITASGALLGALSGSAKSPRQAATALKNLAFGEGATVSPMGLVRDELSELQVRALRGIAAANDISTVQYLGFGDAGDIEPFLRGEAPMWRPLAVETAQGRQRWHLWRIWRACVFEEVGESAAAEVLVTGLEPAALVTAICDSGQPMWTYVRGRTRELAHYRRELALYQAIFSRLRERGFDAGPTLERICREATRPTHALAAGVIVWHALTGSEIPSAQEALVAQAIRFSAGKPLLLELLDKFPPSQAARVRELAEKG